jgi:hypothetical protein
MFNNFENTEDINKVSTVPRAHEHSRFTNHDGNDSETGNSGTLTRMKTCCSLCPMH